MIGLSKTTQETGGAILIKKERYSEIRRGQARVSRTRTLDLGAVIDHRGYSDGDRTFRVRSEVDETDADFLWNMFKSETFINVSTLDGFFYGVIDIMEIDRGLLNMTLLIKE